MDAEVKCQYREKIGDKTIDKLTVYAVYCSREDLSYVTLWHATSEIQRNKNKHQEFLLGPDVELT